MFQPFAQDPAGQPVAWLSGPRGLDWSSQGQDTGAGHCVAGHVGKPQRVQAALRWGKTCEWPQSSTIDGVASLR